MTETPPESISETIPELIPELIPESIPESLAINPEIPQITTPNPLEIGVETTPEVEITAAVSEIPSEPTSEPISEPVKIPESLPSPLRSLTGAAIAGGFAFGLYNLTQAIATSFATKPITSTNPLALSISAAVRTLVVGASTLATGIFTIAAFSLILLALQVAFQPSKPN